MLRQAPSHLGSIQGTGVTQKVHWRLGGEGSTHVLLAEWGHGRKQRDWLSW